MYNVKNEFGAGMTYKDDIEKLRKEAGINKNDPSYFASSSSSDSSSENEQKEEESSKKSSDPFTPDEKEMSFFRRISLPFVRNSILSALFFVLITLVWFAMSHTIVAAIRDVSRTTVMVLIAKDSVFIIILAVIMFRLFRKQYSRFYHTEQELKDSQEQSKKWNAIQQSMMETIPDTLVYTLDKQFRYTSFNNRHKYSMLRIWHQEIRVGDCMLDHLQDNDLKETIKSNLTRVLNGEYLSHIEQFGDNPQTASYWKTFFAPILDEDRHIIGISCFVTNITSLKQSQSKNHFLSYHDQLTELYNRVYCEEIFEQAEKEEIIPFSIITIDIQGMHQINSNYGISTGDKLLVKVSEILTRTIKDNGTIARWGNDEFIVLLPHVDAPTAEALANICKCEFTGVTVNGVPLRARFGYATRTDTDTDLEELLRQAENKGQSDRVQ